MSNGREIGLDETVVASEEQPPSVGAMAIDGDKGSTRVDNEPPEGCSIPDAEVPRRRVPLWCNVVVAVTVAGCAAIATLAVVRGTDHVAATPRKITPANVVVATPPPPAAPAPETKVAAPEPATPVKALPSAIAATAPEPAKPATSKISLAPTVPKKDATLTVDGKKATGTSAVVACGHHTVIVGKGKPQSVEAPCGGAIVVDARKPAAAAKARTSKH
jgi:hypothetical protein